MEHFLQWLEVIISTGNLMNIANRQIIPVVSTFSYTAFSLGDLQNNSKMMLYVDSSCSTFGDQLVINLTMNHTCVPSAFILSESTQS